MDSELKLVTNQKESFFISSELEVKSTESNQTLPTNMASKKENTETFFAKCLNILGSLKLEMLFFLYFCAVSSGTATLSSLLMDKVCRLNLNYSQEICSNLSSESNSAIKNDVERLATNYGLGVNILETTLGTFLSIFIGPWSDIYGRKFPMVIAKCGLIAHAVACLLFAIFPSASPNYLLMSISVAGLTGSKITNWSFYYSYASDTTTKAQRTMKMARLEISVALSYTIGTLIGGAMYDSYGYASVFLFSALALIVNLLGCVFLLPETKGDGTFVETIKKLKKLFSKSMLLESFNLLKKKRSNNGKKQIILLLVCIATYNVAHGSTMSIDYIYIHHQFDWDVLTFSYVKGLYLNIGIIVTVAVVVIAKYLKLGDPAIGLIGTVAMILTNFGTGLAYYPPIYYITKLITFMMLLTPMAVRGRISKIAPTDVGKIFAFIAVLDSLLAVIGSLVITQIFNVTLDLFAGMAYIILAVLLVFIPLPIFIWMKLLPVMEFGDPNETNISEQNILQEKKNETEHVPHELES